jgi:hypothetical protein
MGMGSPGTAVRLMTPTGRVEASVGSRLKSPRFAPGHRYD